MGFSRAGVNNNSAVRPGKSQGDSHSNSNVECVGQIGGDYCGLCSGFGGNIGS